MLVDAAPFVEGKARDEGACVAHRNVEAGPAEFLSKQAELLDAAVGSAGRLGKRQAEPALLGHPSEEGGGIGPRLVPLLRDGRRAGSGNEVACSLLQQPLLVAQSEVH